jgi:protein-arginine kinase
MISQHAGACNYWPKGRGIFHNDDKTFLIWLNEEDHLRIISMQNGSDVGHVLDRLNRGIEVYVLLIYLTISIVFRRWK